MVNAVEHEDGSLTESDKRTGVWAWKHPHQADGSVTYKKLEGAIVLDGVDFGYTDDKWCSMISDFTLSRVRR